MLKDRLILLWSLKLPIIILSLSDTPQAKQKQVVLETWQKHEQLTS